MAKIEQVKNRIESATLALDAYKRKIHKLRRVVAGDPYALDGGEGSQDADSPNKKTDFYDIFVNDQLDGRSNQILQGIRTLVLQTTFYFPELDIEGVTPQEEAVNREFVRVRLGNPPGGCNAQEHLRLALYDFASGGMGWGRVGTMNGIPCIHHADTLDICWDQQARIPSEMRWASCKIRQPAWYWKKVYKSKSNIDPGVDDDDLVEFEYYWDIEGENGRFVVINNDSESDKAVFDGDNPYYFTIQGERVPFIPLEPISFVLLPSVRLAIGLVEQALPAQLGVHLGEDTMYKVLSRMPSWMDVEEGTYTKEQWDKIMDGDIGMMVKRNQGSNPPAQIPAGQLPPSLGSWLEMNKAQLVSQFGVNPYVSGGVVEGTQFASEVQAIAGSAGLMAGTIAKVNAMFWERLVVKFLACGQLYDDMPITVYNIPVPGSPKSIPLDFGPSHPIAQYLRPDAKITIREDSMRYAPREKKMQEAGEKLQMALAVAQFFPNWLPNAAREYLKASGEKDIEDWLRPPQPMMPQMPPQGPQGPQDAQGADTSGLAQKQAVNQAMAPPPIR